jgi:hypothetical protein
MITLILECLKLDLPSTSENIAIAKGKYKLPATFKELVQWLKK